MPSIKEYNRKIGSLKNTSKITKTMKLVSASKLRRAQDRQRDASHFADEVNKLVYRIAGAFDSSIHPLLTPKASVKKVLFIGFTSDKGLCGGFNNSLIKFIERELKERTEKGEEVELSFCGRRGFNHFRSRATIKSNYENVTAAPDAIEARKIATEACESFLSGEFDEVYLVYNQFQSPLTQTPFITKFLPLEAEDFEFEGTHEVSHNFIAEPDVGALLDNLIPRILDFQLFFSLLENSAGEHGARMTAMDNASANAGKMIDSYTMKRNRARQAAITTELIEIISGAEAL